MGWVIALVVIILIACLPVGISARYDEDGAVASLIAGPLRVVLYPRNARKKKAKKKTQKEPSTNSGSGTKGGSYKDFLPILQEVLKFVKAFGGRLKVSRLDFKLILASNDPYDLSVNYGYAWVALGNVMPHLERVFAIREKNVSVECDFMASDTIVVAQIDLVIPIGKLLYITGFHGVRALYSYIKIVNQRKGGAK